MKTEAIVIAALAGLAYWYFMREQPATVTTVKLPFPETPPFSINTAQVQANWEAMRAARASQPTIDIRSSAGIPGHGGMW